MVLDKLQWNRAKPLERDARFGRGYGIENAIVPFALQGQCIPAQGANPGNRIRENRCVLKEHRIRGGGVDVRLGLAGFLLS